MKMTTFLIFGLFVVLASVIIIAIKAKTNVSPSGSNQSELSADNSNVQENPFKDLREMSLSVTADQIGIQILDDQTKVFGIVMDWDLGNGIATVVGYESGDASMYLSSGGGVIGGGQHDNVRSVVIPYIKLGQDYLSKTTKTETTPLPDQNCIRFYLLTNNGTYYVQEKMENIEKENSDWLKLFEGANKVLTELRLISEKK